MSGEPENGSSKAAKIVGAVAGFATFIGCVASMVSAGSETTANSETSADKKMMKAPGRPGEFIERAEFEDNPAGHFRNLRKK